MILNHVMHVARDEEHTNAGAPAADAIDQLTAVHAGHDHISHDEVRALRPVQQRQRLGTASGHEYPIARSRECAVRDLSNRPLILDYENRLAAANGFRHRLGVC